MTRGDRRALLIGALIVGPSLVYWLAVRPLWRVMQSSQQRLWAERSLLAEENALLRVASAYPRVLQENERELMHEAPRLFDGTDSVIASSQFGEYVITNAISSNVFVQSNTAGEIVPVGNGVMSLQVDILAEGDLAGVLSFLQRLEKGTKLIRVSKLELAPSPRLALPDSTSPALTEVLTFRATVNGFALASLKQTH